MLSLFAVFSLLSSSGIVPFTFAALAATSGDHQVSAGMDEEHFRLRLIHHDPSEQSGCEREGHRHDLSSKVITLFAEAPDRDGDDHDLQFHRLGTGLTDDNRMVVDKPDLMWLSRRLAFESQRRSNLPVRFEIGARHQPPGGGALRVARSTVLLI